MFVRWMLLTTATLLAVVVVSTGFSFHNIPYHIVLSTRTRLQPPSRTAFVRKSRTTSRLSSLSSITPSTESIGVVLSHNNTYSSSSSFFSNQTFRELYADALPNWLLDKCDACGYIHPTRVQQEAFRVLLLQNQQQQPSSSSLKQPQQQQQNYVDVAIQAHTGSGKTLCYLLPVLAGIDPSRSALQALIIVPTRELGLQVSRVAKRLAASSAESTAVTTTTTDDHYDDCDDGITDTIATWNESSMESQQPPQQQRHRKNKILIMSVLQGSQHRRQRAWAWAEPPHVVVGTPKDVATLIQRGALKTYTSIRYVVVDEVDACMQQDPTIFSLLLSRLLSPTFDQASNHRNDDHDYGGVNAVLSKAMSSSSSSMSPSFRNKQRQTIFCSATIPQPRHFLKQCVQQQWTTREPVFVNTLYSDTAATVASNTVLGGIDNTCFEEEQEVDKGNNQIGNDDNTDITDNMIVSSASMLPSTLNHTYLVCASTSQKLTALRRWFLKSIIPTSALPLPIPSSPSSSSSEFLQPESSPSSTSPIAPISVRKVLIFCRPNRPLEEMAQVLAKDLSGIYWKENSRQLFQQQYDQEKPVYHAVISVLRFQDSLSERAAAMDVFYGNMLSSFNKLNGGSNQVLLSPTIPDSSDARFRSNIAVLDSISLRVLLSNDLAARGLDVTDVSHVIHFDLPDAAADYVHRSGRTGRLGQSGTVLSIITPPEEFVLQRWTRQLRLSTMTCIGRQRL